jgi:outer membrane beta-barrel protein
MDIDTGLTAELNERWDVSPTDTPKLDYAIDTNLMIKPLVGKMALFDDAVIYSETYFVVGIGAENINGAFFPAMDVGAGMRIFLSDTISLRFEAREYLYLEEGGVGNALFLGVSFCYNGFADDRKVDPNIVEQEDQEVKP